MYDYNATGTVKSILHPGQSTPAARTQVKTVTDWLDHTTEFAYDPDRNLKTATFPNGVTDNRGYDNADRLGDITDKNDSGTTLAEFAYTRDPARRPHPCCISSPGRSQIVFDENEHTRPEPHETESQHRPSPCI